MTHLYHGSAIIPTSQIKLVSGFFAGLMKKSKTDIREKQGGTLFGSGRVDDTEEKLQKLFDGLLQKSDDGEFITYKYHRYIVGSFFDLETIQK